MALSRTFSALCRHALAAPSVPPRRPAGAHHRLFSYMRNPPQRFQPRLATHEACATQSGPPGSRAVLPGLRCIDLTKDGHHVRSFAVGWWQTGSRRITEWASIQPHDYGFAVQGHSNWRTRPTSSMADAEVLGDQRFRMRIAVNLEA